MGSYCLIHIESCNHNNPIDCSHYRNPQIVRTSEITIINDKAVFIEDIEKDTTYHALIKTEAREFFKTFNNAYDAGIDLLQARLNESIIEAILSKETNPNNSTDNSDKHRKAFDDFVERYHSLYT